MSDFKHIYVSCKIMARSNTAHTRLYRGHEKRYFADSADPARLKCLGCGFEWGCCALEEWQNATCSNCYSEKLMLIAARLEFNSWGAQNGGVKERDGRFQYAKETARKLGTLLRKAP